MFFLAKYGVQTAIEFAMVKRGVVDLATTSDWTPATGDTKIIKDGANATNSTNNPSAIGGTGSVGWTLTLTATELQCARLQIQIVDSATKAVEDQFITVYTYGHASAKIAPDWSLPDCSAIRAATAQGGAANSITLDSGASSTNGLYDPSIILIRSGTGAGQVRTILDYNGTSKVAIVDRAWRTNPDNTSVFEIYPVSLGLSVNEGLAQGGGASTITLNSLASSTDNVYVGQVIGLRGGTGADQTRIITAYNGTTKVATVDRIWTINPDNTTVYIVYQVQSPKLDASLQTTDVNSANMDIAVSTRASQTSVNTIDDFIDTEIADIQSRLPSSLLGGRMDSHVSVVDSGSITSSSLAATAVTKIRSVASGTGSGTTTTITDGSRSEEGTDYWKGSFILFTNGILSGLSRLITGYNDGTGQFTFAPALPSAPSSTTYEIIPAARVDLHSWLGSVANSLISGRVDSSVGALAADVITDASVATDMDAYQAKVWVFDDNGGNTDRYITIWFKNGTLITSGVTSPTIQVVKASDGSDLVASTAMTEIGTTETFKKDETTNRIVSGSAYVAIVTASIDGSTRTWAQPIGRDS